VPGADSKALGEQVTVDVSEPQLHAGCGRSFRAMTRSPLGQEARCSMPVSSVTQAPGRTRPAECRQASRSGGDLEECVLEVVGDGNPTDCANWRGFCHWSRRISTRRRGERDHSAACSWRIPAT
jgi:hypothetical protein